MNTSAEALKQIQAALAQAQAAQEVVDNLIATHDYQDVTSLVLQATTKLLAAATALMQSDDESALSDIENAEDLLDSVYDVIEGDLDL